MKNLILILSILILIVSCKKEPLDCPPDCNNPSIDSVYYINQIFEINALEKPFILDTTRLVQNGDSFVHPKYRIEILSIDEQRCDYNACVVCFGGFVHVDVKLSNIYTNNNQNDTLDYPSCSDGLLSGGGMLYPPLILDSVKLSMLRVLPQPGSEPHHYDLGYIPPEEYKISFKLQKQL
jgi:hypothetical protein